MPQSVEVKLLRATLIDLVTRLEAAGVDYMVIGGMAVIAWGYTRSTNDVDLAIAIDRHDAQKVIDVLGDAIASHPSNAVEFAAETGILPFKHRNGKRVDLGLSEHPYVRTAMARAVAIKVQGKPVKFCTVEDLILHKIVSDRDRDRNDVKQLLLRHRKNLDRDYLDPLVQELAATLARPEIEQRYHSFLAS